MEEEKKTLKHYAQKREKERQEPCDPHVPEERDIIPRKRKKTCKSSRRTCCDQLFEMLQDVPGVDPKKKHKPKVPNKVKVSCLCDTWPTKDAMAPILFHILERHAKKKQPGDEFERELFRFLDSVPSDEMEAMKSSLDAYKALPESKLDCLFKREFLDLQIDETIDIDTVAKAWIDEGLIFANDELNDEPVCFPGQVRPWEYTPIVINGISEPTTAPWPFICSVNGIRKRDHRPPLDYYNPEEYNQECTYTYNEDTGEVTDSCQYKQPPFCDVNAGSHNDICLTIATGRAGQSAELIGFNFFSSNCKVTLTLRDQPSITYTLDATVCGDSNTPRAEQNGTIIADCRVQDRVSFRIPDKSPNGFNDFLPGIYTVNVIVPNDIGYTLANGSTPIEFNTSDVYSTSLLNIKPVEGLKYRISSYKSKCYDETDGEWFSDEIWIKAIVTTFNMVGDEVEIDLKTDIDMLTEMSDADEGESWEYDWRIVGEPQNPTTVNGTLAIALIGYEVDSEDAAKKEIKSWSDAFVLYIKKVWDLIKDKIEDIVKGLGALGLKWGLIVGAVSLVITAAIGVIWAMWAPPDRMLRDLIVLDEERLFNLTHPTTALPATTTRVIENVTIQQIPESKLGFLYTEERQYSSSDQGSKYGLWFAYQREA